MTPAAFATLRHACGLTQQEAADYLGVSKRTIESWEDGTRGIQPGRWADMVDLTAAVETHARAATEHAEHVRYRSVEAYRAAGNDALPMPAYHAVIERAIAARIAVGLPWAIRWAEAPAPI